METLQSSHFRDYTTFKGNNDMRIKTASIFLFAILLLVLLFSCEENSIAVFYSLEHESEVEDNKSLDNDITVTNIERFGDYYYISAGNLYRRDTKGSTQKWVRHSEWPGWDSATGELKDGLCTEFTVFNETIYAIFYSVDGTETGLFQYNGNEWKKIENGLTGLRLDKILSINQTLFVAARDSGSSSWKLYFSRDGESFTDTGIGDFFRPIISGTWVPDTAATDSGTFYLVTGKKVYSGDDPENLSVAEDFPSADNGYGGIYYSRALKVLFLSTADGYVHANDGSGWGTSNQAEGVSLTDMEELNVDDNIVIVVGSSNGYYEIIVAEETGLDKDNIVLRIPGTGAYYSTNINYLNTTLSSAVILKFYRDEEKDYLFGCTSGEGLWRNQQANGYRLWNRE